ncbi:MAG TPA: SusC/RagA family TonB-linked outer membrane protein [Mucilaginibacter sp.]|jgi:iron complex outermembrane receptor protein
MYLKNLLKVSCFILLCFFVIPAMAQNKTVTGKVTDSKDGSTLIGASVVAKGSTIGAITDVNGVFRLSVPANATTLVISYIGYVNKEVAITDGPINITLDQNNSTLSEVLVIGYSTVRKKDATGAVVKVNADEFVKGVTTNPLQQIQGKAAGVVVSTITGDPNADPVVRVRGTASLSGGNDPLYVIDGVAGADIRSVSPNDIESFDILKDASAAAIYGSRAAGGVILITTKTGKAGKMQVFYNGYVASESAAHMVDFMDRSQYLSAYQFNNPGNPGHTPMPVFDPAKPSTTSDQGANTNWFKELLQTGFTQNHNIAVGGGSDKSHYRASLSYTNQDGIVKSTSRQDIQGRFNFDQRTLNDKLLITINAAASETNSGNIGGNGVVFLDAAAVPSVISVYDPNHPGNYQLINNTQEANPVPQLLYITNTGVVDRMSANLRFDYTILKGWILSPYANMSKTNGSNLIYYPPSQLVSPIGDQFGYTPQLTNHGDVDRTDSTATNQTYGVTSEYRTTFGKSRLHVLGGYEYDSFVYTGLRVGAHDFNDINLPNENIGAANAVTTKDIFSYNKGYVLNSWFARAEYIYNDKYYLTGSVRYDNSNKLGLNNQSGVFPSFDVAWVISNEDFLKSTQWITSLKLRGGYGQVGNQDAIGPYTSQFLFGPNGKLYYDGATGTFLPSNFATQNANPDLRWEVDAETNVAVDFSLFNGRLNGSFDYYDKTTSHLLNLYTVPTGGQFFVNKILANIGTMTNKGYEFTVSYKVIKNRNFSWTAGGNLGVNHNKITSLSGTFDNNTFNVTQTNTGSVSGLGISGAISNVAYLKVGMPVGTVFLPEYAGQASNGSQEFYYKNTKTGQRDTTSNVSLLNYADDGSGDRKFYSTEAKFTYGINNDFTYKRFDLNLFLRGSYGNKAFNETYMDYTSLSKLGTYSVLADAPKYGITSSSEPSSFWLENASYLKIQSASLGYTLSFADSKYVDRLHIYIAGNNLYTFTSYKGGDPEITPVAALANSQAGIETRSSLYPRTRQFSFGVNLTLK